MGNKFNLEYPIPEAGVPEVTLKFMLPEGRQELMLALKGGDYSGILWEIYSICRNVTKYEPSPSEERIRLAEEIGALVRESGIIDLP